MNPVFIFIYAYMDIYNAAAESPRIIFVRISVHPVGPQAALAGRLFSNTTLQKGERIRDNSKTII